MTMADNSFLSLYLENWVTTCQMRLLRRSLWLAPSFWVVAKRPASIMDYLLSKLCKSE